MVLVDSVSAQGDGNPARPGDGHWRELAAQRLADESVDFAVAGDEAFRYLQQEFADKAGKALTAAIKRARAERAGLSAIKDAAGRTLAIRFDDGKAGKLDMGPIPIDRVRRLLEYDESLAFIVPDKNGGFLYVLRPDAAVFFSLPPEPDPGRLATTLRCMAAARVDPACGSAAKLKVQATTSDVSRGATSLTAADTTAFDLDASYEIFARLIPADALANLKSRDGLATQDNKLIIVSSKELLGLPWHLLVTEQPDDWMRDPQYQVEANKKAAWLFKSFGSVSVLPDLASLEALRGERWVHSGLDTPFLGIADPLIGRSAAERNAPPAKCTKDQTVALASGVEPERRAVVDPGVRVTEMSSGRQAYADVEAIRNLPRLVDTRCEVESAQWGPGAGSFRSSSRTLLFGADATETRLKQMNVSGELALYRAIHFATHGLVGGQLGVGESGLILSPPGNASELDDGVLTAPEIASLRLNADLVILSACDTAAGGGGATEPLSGLASAFFAAGAHTLIVSSWPVYSKAATDLMTSVATISMSDPTAASPGEALSKAMSRMLASANNEFTASPAYWAPFFVVGDPRLVDDMIFTGEGPEGTPDTVTAKRNAMANGEGSEAK
ncbi:CHAT domain-containing protein [Mesorhizobium sp. M0062]|uniref:CHAT domain-containing protein n=1 Tax=Mesorhizobium sp. M0062 TaxID=2956867 RepID=UPI00333926D4